MILLGGLLFRFVVQSFGRDTVMPIVQPVSRGDLRVLRGVDPPPCGETYRQAVVRIAGYVRDNDDVVGFKWFMPLVSAFVKALDVHGVDNSLEEEHLTVVAEAMVAIKARPVIECLHGRCGGWIKARLTLLLEAMDQVELKPAVPV